MKKDKEIASFIMQKTISPRPQVSKIFIIDQRFAKRRLNLSFQIDYWSFTGNVFCLTVIYCSLIKFSETINLIFSQLIQELPNLFQTPCLKRILKFQEAVFSFCAKDRSDMWKSHNPLQVTFSEILKMATFTHFCTRCTSQKDF